MKLSDQVCTLDQAKRLKELGITAPSLWSRFIAASHSGYVLTEMKVRHVWIVTGNAYNEEDIEFTPVFTVAELGQMLPDDLQPNTGRHWSWYHRRTWKGESVGYSTHGFDPIEQGWFDTEAEARAAMLIHLLETKTITAEEVNKRLQ